MNDRNEEQPFSNLFAHLNRQNTDENIEANLTEIITQFKSSKKGRTQRDRHLAICITELEGVLARFRTFIKGKQ